MTKLKAFVYRDKRHIFIINYLLCYLRRGCTYLYLDLYHSIRAEGW